MLMSPITDSSATALLDLDTAALRSNLDRRPFGFDHALHRLPLFQPQALHRLAERYVDAPQHYYVSGSSPEPGAVFYSGAAVNLRPHEALEQLDSARYRILLKRMELFDPEFRELLQRVFNQVIEASGGLGGARLVRLESALFITAAATITPFHYDPELNFFSQIEGEKTYHLYAPAAVSEEELESFYVRGVVDIAQVDLASRERSHEHTFALVPGKGLHQPQNSPHWVETSGSRSVSYVFVYETTATRAKSRVRAFNYYLRSMGLRPSLPGRHPGVDAAKAAAMKVVLPVRRRVSRVVSERAGRGRPAAG